MLTVEEKLWDNTRFQELVLKEISHQLLILIGQKIFFVCNSLVVTLKQVRQLSRVVKQPKN